MIKISKAVNRHYENKARHQLIEELFNDFYRSRRQVYWLNFNRGLFFGFGTILGGTVFIAFLIWLLGQFASWFPLIGDYIRDIINTIQ